MESCPPGGVNLGLKVRRLFEDRLKTDRKFGQLTGRRADENEGFSKNN
jgi:hypothetical protein